MQLVVLANENLKEELLSDAEDSQVPIIWIENAEEFSRYKDVIGFIDLLFDNSLQRIELLRSLSSKPVIINSVALTLKEINAPFVRINAWPGFLKRSVVEASHNNENTRELTERIFSILNKQVRWVADRPGFITARVIAAIINEAYFALEEKVSAKAEIDTAMKLGTNYPYGPFDWARKIGLKNIYELLKELSQSNPRYKPAASLEKDAIS